MTMGCAGAIKQGATFEDFVVRSAAVFVSQMASPLAGLQALDECPLSAELTEARADLLTLEAMTEEQAQAESDAEYAALCANREAIRADRDQLRQRYEATLVRLLAWNPQVEVFETFKASMMDEITQSIERDCGVRPEPPIPHMPAHEWRIQKMVQQSLLISHLERRNNHFMVLQALRTSLGIAQDAPT